MNQSVQSVHRVLDYLITKAAVTAKPGKSTVRIPYKALLESIGQKTTNNEIELVIEIKLSWDEPLTEE